MSELLADPEQLLIHDAFVRGLAHSLVNDPHRADDLAQQTWLAAIQQAPVRYTSLRAWLGGVVRHLAGRAARTEMRRDRREHLAARPDRVPSTAEIVEREAVRRQVVQAVLELDEPYRATVLLRYFERLPPREVARRLGVPVETERTRVKRALEMLRARLDDSNGGDRRAWCLPLLPLASARSTGLAAAGSALHVVATGVLIMTTKAKLAGAAALILGLLLAAFWLVPLLSEGGMSPDGTPLTAGANALAIPPTDARDTDASVLAADAPRKVVSEPAASPTHGALLVHAAWAEGTPASGVPVRARAQRDKSPNFEVRSGITDENGTHLFDDLPPARWVVEPLGRLPTGALPRVDVEAGRRAEVKLALRNGIDVTGVVVEEEGAPVADADVTVAPPLGDYPTALTRTDARGRFALRALHDHACVGARVKGYAPSRMHVVQGSEGSRLELRLVLPGPGGALEGTVRDPSGGPVTGAFVQAGPDQRIAASDPLPDGSLAMPAQPVLERTDGDGRFRVDGLAAGEVPVVVYARTFAPWHGTAAVAEGRTSRLDVGLLPGVTLLGTVRDQHGAPVQGVEITVGDRTRFGVPRTRTDANGHYRIDALGTGELSVRAGAEARGEARAVLTATPGQTLRWDARLSRGLSIRGRVVDEHGEPLESVSLYATSDGAGHGWSGGAWTGDDGRFALTNCPSDEPIRIDVSLGGFRVERLRRVRPGSDEVLIRIPEASLPSVHFVGRVVDPEGNPAANVSVRASFHVDGRLRGSGGCTNDAVTGAFRIGPYPPGDYQLKFEARGFPVVRTEWRDVGPDQTRDAGTVRLPRPGWLLARLHPAAGPVPAELSLRILDARGEWTQWLRVENGTGHSTPLAPGRYELQVHGPGIASELHPFEVHADEKTRLDVPLRAGVPVSLRFLVGDSDDPPPVRVQVLDENGRPVLRARAWGELSFAVAPGSYSVTASTDAGERGESALDVGIDGGVKEPIDVTLR